MLELEKILEGMVAMQKQSRWRQNMHALHCREKEEANICRVLTQMERANLELVVRINLAHVAITRDMAKNIKSIMTENEARSERLERQEGGNTLEAEQQEEEDEQKQQESKEQEPRVLIIEHNQATDEAHQFNGIVGLDSPACAKIVENRSFGMGRQKNLILGGPMPPQFLDAVFS